MQGLSNCGSQSVGLHDIPTLITNCYIAITKAVKKKLWIEGAHEFNNSEQWLIIKRLGPLMRKISLTSLRCILHEIAYTGKLKC